MALIDGEMALLFCSRTFYHEKQLFAWRSYLEIIGTRLCGALFASVMCLLLIQQMNNSSLVEFKLGRRVYDNCIHSGAAKIFTATQF